MKKIRVLVIDDSALMRQLSKEILQLDRTIEVVGSAKDPFDAREKILALNPDVLTLDVEMPRMDGLSFLEKLMAGRPMPVVMLSSLTEKGCQTTMRALELGAVDFITKPKLDVVAGMDSLVDEIIEKESLLRLRTSNAAQFQDRVSQCVIHVMETLSGLVDRINPWCASANPIEAQQHFESWQREIEARYAIDSERDVSGRPLVNLLTGTAQASKAQLAACSVELF